MNGWNQDHDFRPSPRGTGGAHWVDYIHHDHSALVGYWQCGGYPTTISRIATFASNEIPELQIFGKSGVSLFNAAASLDLRDIPYMGSDSRRRNSGKFSLFLVLCRFDPDA